MKKVILSITVLCLLCLQACSSEKRREEKRTRTESYIDYEKEQVTLTYIVKDSHMYYHRTDGNPIPMFEKLPRLKAYCTLTNTSDYGGTFKFYATLSSLGNTISFETQEYIAAGSTVLISQEKEINHHSFKSSVQVDSWGIIPDTKEIIKEVVKYRTVEY
jgi:hypothetical protein